MTHRTFRQLILISYLVLFLGRRLGPISPVPGTGESCVLGHLGHYNLHRSHSFLLHIPSTVRVIPVVVSGDTKTSTDVSFYEVENFLSRPTQNPKTTSTSRTGTQKFTRTPVLTGCIRSRDSPSGQVVSSGLQLVVF